MRRAVYIGRFQVFHLGHLDVLHHMAAAPDVDHICLVVGSTQYDHTHKSPVATWSHNPFTLAERTEMIERSIDGRLRVPWSLHPIPDFHDWVAWHAHIVAELPPFHVLYSADRDEHVFFSIRGTECRRFPRQRDFHAGSIREALADGGAWRHAVPEGAAVVLDRIDAGARLRELRERDRAA